MSVRRRWLALLPRQLRYLPADLAVVALLTVAAALAATLPGVEATPLRIAFGLPYLLFLPGYALISALVPEAGPDRGSGGDGDGRRDSDGSADVRGPNGRSGAAASPAARPAGDASAIATRFSSHTG